LQKIISRFLSNLTVIQIKNSQKNHLKSIEYFCRKLIRFRIIQKDTRKIQTLARRPFDYKIKMSFVLGHDSYTHLLLMIRVNDFSTPASQSPTNNP
jgi:hypothetical protein